MPEGKVCGSFEMFPAASRFRADQHASSVTTSYPAAWRPPLTIASAICLIRVSSMPQAKRFQLFQPIVGKVPIVAFRIAGGHGEVGMGPGERPLWLPPESHGTRRGERATTRRTIPKHRNLKR